MSDERLDAPWDEEDATATMSINITTGKADGRRIEAGRTAEWPSEMEEDRRRREEEESMELARLLMAEEAMASYEQHFNILRESGNNLVGEEYEAWQAALREEEREEVEELGDERGELSYDAMLQLGDRIGDVKMERWALVAKQAIAKLSSFAFNPATSPKAGNLDDSEHKCLVCQCEYEKGEVLRRLPCKHCFHQNCVDQWLMGKDCCPYCRNQISS